MSSSYLGDGARIDPMSVTVDVPDQDGLGGELPCVNGRTRVDLPQSPLELRDRGYAVVDDELCERDEHGIGRWVDNQRGPHRRSGLWGRSLMSAGRTSNLKADARTCNLVSIDMR